MLFAKYGWNTDPSKTRGGDGHCKPRYRLRRVIDPESENQANKGRVRAVLTRSRTVSLLPRVGRERGGKLNSGNHSKQSETG